MYQVVRPTDIHLGHFFSSLFPVKKTVTKITGAKHVKVNIAILDSTEKQVKIVVRLEIKSRGKQINLVITLEIKSRGMQVNLVITLWTTSKGKQLNLIIKVKSNKPILLCRGKLTKAWGLGGLFSPHSKDSKDLSSNALNISL